MYIVANSTPLRNIAFQWLTSDYMQLENGFMQLVVVRGRRNIVHFYCLFRRKNVNSSLEWGTIITVLISGGISPVIRLEITFYRPAYASL